MDQLKNVKLGADIEVFLRTLDGKLFPVCGLVGGTKENPEPIPSLGDGFAVQEDNAALEFNVPPAKDPYAWDSNIRAVIRHIEKKKIPDGLYLDWDQASGVFANPYLEIPQMQVFGCEPDFNVYTKTTNDKPRPPVPGFRSAAGHVHMGWDDPTEEQRFEMVKLCDVFAVLPGLAYENKSEVERRKLYGRAGAFRPKPYGFEHRVLSNRWAGKNRYGVFERYFVAVKAYNGGMTVDPKDYDKIQACINEGHIKLANSIYSKYWDEYNGISPVTKALKRAGVRKIVPPLIQGGEEF